MKNHDMLMPQIEQEINILAKALRKFNKIKIDRYYGWDYPHLNIIDCVLSLNRRYDSFVVPRIKLFEENHPEVKTMGQFKNIINNMGEQRFMISELNYNDRKRAAVLKAVVVNMCDVLNKYQGDGENDKYRKWAMDVKPGDYELFGVHGFGLAGFQYLRMLFGAQTIKPDIHIKRYVSRIVGRNVNDMDSLEYLEKAAKIANIPIREADFEIWERGARRK